MAQQRTAFDDFFDQQTRNPEVASAYAELRAEVDEVDQFMRALEGWGGASRERRTQTLRGGEDRCALRRVASCGSAAPRGSACGIWTRPQAREPALSRPPRGPSGTACPAR